MDRPTVEVYEQHASRWVAHRTPRLLAVSERLARRVDDAADGLVADLGCGPGWYAAPFGRRAVALDAARAMLDLVPDRAPGALRVQADLDALPFARGVLAGALGSKSYVHLPRSALPLALADLHRALPVGAPVELVLFGGDDEFTTFDHDDMGGVRHFSTWPVALLRSVLVGAGFVIDDLGADDAPDHHDLLVSLTRARTLADTVGPGMRLLVCGLNPSVYAADAGVGFARPGNRFWPAALAAGLVAHDRDPVDALRSHGIGMTDIVKRATRRADALRTAEYRDGMARLETLVDWLRPGAVCFVGLSGWRAAVDRDATAGLQPSRMADRPVYVMPSTSGVNAHASLDALTRHLRAAVALGD